MQSTSDVKDSIIGNTLFYLEINLGKISSLTYEYMMMTIILSLYTTYITSWYIKMSIY